MPAVTQYQSPDFIAAIAYEGADPADDPLWWRSGAGSREEYGFWSRRSCGMACLQMVLTHRGQPVPPLQHLMRDGIACGAYRPKEDGSVLGLLYAPFLEYVREVHQIDGAVHPELSLRELSEELDRGGMVLASVHKEIRRPSLPSPGRGGHLVLAIGRDSRGVHFRNPSGHTEEARYGLLPAEVFETFFGRRGVTLRVA
ncbi:MULTISPECIES: peptidase [unclassified Streptomyces]|uniref:peptidase n=1 Tax=unclassified Streptomyces TaxID=2593676 RepID=UPI00236579BE|nr:MULTISPECIES: peptidase [unclassified Streptomyces]MDF3139920.1 peptidase [Streptomyces sp. T21Q-yed]WDF44007.1 peptidase [Streptomyces sp. T12]